MLNYVSVDDLFNKYFSIKETNHVCKFCNKSFAHRQGKHKHEKTCKQIPNIINNNTTNNNTTNNNCNFTTNNIHNIYIQTNPFGNEKYDYINFKELMNDNLTMLKLIEEIHFNKDHPENWNVCINNLRSKYAEIYDGTECIVQDKLSTINKLIKDKCNIMIQKSMLCDDENRSEKMKQSCEEVVEYIESKEHHDKNKDYNERFGNRCEKNTNYKTAYNKTEATLYNNKNCFQETKNKLKDKTDGSEFF